MGILHYVMYFGQLTVSIPGHINEKACPFEVHQSRRVLGRWDSYKFVHYTLVSAELRNDRHGYGLRRVSRLRHILNSNDLRHPDNYIT